MRWSLRKEARRRRQPARRKPAEFESPKPSSSSLFPPSSSSSPISSASQLAATSIPPATPRGGVFLATSPAHRAPHPRRAVSTHPHHPCTHIHHPPTPHAHIPPRVWQCHKPTEGQSPAACSQTTQARARRTRQGDGRRQAHGEMRASARRSLWSSADSPPGAATNGVGRSDALSRTAVSTSSPRRLREPAPSTSAPAPSTSAPRRRCEHRAVDASTALCTPAPSTLSPTPSTLVPAPSTLSPALSTSAPAPSTSAPRRRCEHRAIYASPPLGEPRDVDASPAPSTLALAPSALALAPSALAPAPSTPVPRYPRQSHARPAPFRTSMIQKMLAPVAKKLRLTLRTPRSPSPPTEQAPPSPSEEAIFGSLDEEYAEELQALQALRAENAELHTDNDRLRVGARQLRQTNRDLQAQVESLTAKWVDSEKARRTAEAAAAPSQARATDLQQRLTASQLTLAASQDRVGQLDRELRATKEALAAKSLAYDNQAAGNASLESENIQRTDEFVQASATLRAQLAEARAELLSAQAALLTSVPRQKYDAAQREVAQLRSIAQASLRVVLTPRRPVWAVGVQAGAESLPAGLGPALSPRALSVAPDYAALLARYEGARDDARSAQDLLRQQRADSSAFRVQSVREMRELVDRVVGLEEQFAAVERERDVLQDELAQRHEVAELVRGLPPAPTLDSGDAVDVEVHRMRVHEQARAAVDLDAVRRRAASQMVAFGVRLRRLSRDVAAVGRCVEQADVDGARASLVALRESFEVIVDDLFDAGGVWVDLAALPKDAVERVLAQRRQ
ncbi:hypothetical protein PLICRDRAFT_180412 [Plicaturopsis crispa FD-325 SS-3]|uniref:Uncharacterized protein n=1 Tax=Plicaturopsis crispa FD-325 SS-3 TaxID=944288 RepID=A0A0C9SW52_PLICR|nr:hypothetical protein PLICRDRAFT_180412 [Plicaturopsis crispa FD-325 SS-3]